MEQAGLLLSSTEIGWRKASGQGLQDSALAATAQASSGHCCLVELKSVPCQAGGPRAYLVDGDLFLVAHGGDLVEREDQV